MSGVAPHRSLGRLGIWSLELRFGDRNEATDAVAELESLGYSAVWIPGGMGGDLFGDIERLLKATQHIVVASGVLNLWKHAALDVGAWWQSLSDEHRSRLLLGVGVSHSHIVGQDYRQPLTRMREYLDGLAAAGVPSDALCLAALGPKMTELARDRSAGAHPYLVTPEHTAQSRAVLGPGKLLAPEQGVILERDADRARALGRQALSQYRTYANYANSWRRLGFTDNDIDNASDRLVDALFAWGSVDAIRNRLDAHYAAGADHVCVQVISGAGVSFASARAAWRELAVLLH